MHKDFKLIGHWAGKGTCCGLGGCGGMGETDIHFDIQEQRGNVFKGSYKVTSNDGIPTEIFITGAILSNRTVYIQTNMQGVHFFGIYTEHHNLEMTVMYGPKWSPNISQYHVVLEKRAQ